MWVAVGFFNLISAVYCGGRGGESVQARVGMSEEKSKEIKTGRKIPGLHRPENTTLFK